MGWGVFYYVTLEQLAFQMSSRPEEPSFRELGRPALRNDLKHIVELTEENDPEHALPPPAPPVPPNCLLRSLRCLRGLWSRRSAVPALEVDSKEKDLRALLGQIRSSKAVYGAVLPRQKQRRKVLVVELDGTLAHTSFSRPAEFDFELEVVVNGKKTKIYTSKRFGLDSFLFEMSQLYEIVVFTTSLKSYADKILDLVDPKRRIAHRLYRSHCLLLNKTHLLKNVRVLGRPMEDLVVVDHSQLAALLQPDHFYAIETYQGSPKDRQLCRLAAFLKYLHPKQHMHPLHHHRQQFEQMEIELPQEERGQAQRRFRHRKRNSQLQALAVETVKTEEDTASSEPPHPSASDCLSL